MGATTSLLTFEEFERLPETDDPGKCELLEGELIQLPPPEADHTLIAHGLYEALKPAVAQADSLGRVLIEMGYKIGRKTWFVPDVSVLHPGQSRGKYFEGAPLLAIEIISESNKAADVDRKIKLYLANGSQEVWVVYPATRCVWVYRAEGAQEFRGVLRSRLIEGREIDLAAIFG